MTNSSLKETTQPVVTSPNSRGVVKTRVATEEALELLDLAPVKTVWASDGRTILERLPKQAGTYQVGYEGDEAYVYIDPVFGVTYGSGSCQVGMGTQNPALLAVQDGVVTWKEGQANLPLLEVDTSTLNQGLGLQSGEYQVGYTLRIDKPTAASPVPGYSLVSVKDESLASSALDIASSGETQVHQKQYAIDSEAATRTWFPNAAASAVDYWPGEWFAIDLQQPVSSLSFRLIADAREPAPTSLCTAYWSDDAIIWNKHTEVRPTIREWNLDVSSTTAHRYWRFFFWNGTVSLSDIRYTGDAYYPDLRVAGGVTIAEPYIDDLYETIEGDHVLLAHFTVVGGVITEVRDQRSFINRKYEPVSAWLTTFPDEQISCLFDDVQNYSTKFLAPPSADFHLYDEMDDNICTGLGELTLGNEEDDSGILFPDVVEIVSGETVVFDAEIQTETEEDVVTEPLEDLLLAEGLVSLGPAFVCSAINLVLDPVTEDGLATKVSTDKTFAQPWSVDDGIY